MPTANPPREYYRRKLPHLQNGKKAVFVSMGTKKHLFLSSAARTVVLEHIVSEARYVLHCTVVMPDHVHLLFTICENDGRNFALADIMHGIRGASAHRVNKLLGRNGAVWEEEFYDRLLRYGQFEKAINYICWNPVRAELVMSEEQYPWLRVSPEV